METSQNFTSRLDRLKFSLGVTDDELARRVGVSRRMLWLIKSGKSAITKKTLWKLDKAERLAGLGSKSETVSDLTPPTPGKYLVDGVQRLEKAVARERGVSGPAVRAALKHLRAAVDELERALES